MAISLGYGILFATAISLLLVPSLFLVVEDMRGLVKSKGRAHHISVTEEPAPDVTLSVNDPTA